MGKLMLKADCFNQTEELYNILFHRCSDKIDQAALEYYEKYLEIIQKILPQDHSSLTNTCKNITQL